MRTVFGLVLVAAFFALLTGCGPKEAPPVEGEKEDVAVIEVQPVVVEKMETVVEVKADTGKKPVEEVAPEKKPVGKKFVLRINCGSEEDYTDPAKNVWKTDKEFTKGGWGYEGGDIVTREYVDKIAKTELHKVYLTEHFGLDAYRITCPNGTYSVVLHFAETYHEDPGMRVFDVSIEGKKVLSDFDTVKAAGKDLTAVSKTFEVKVTDGELTIEFGINTENPMINGIEVIGK